MNKLVFIAYPLPKHHCCAECAEMTVMAHRYLYHVAGLPVMPDAVYDALAARARAILPQSSPVHSPGGLFVDPEDYSEFVRLYAHGLIF